MLLRLAYLTVTTIFAFLRLLPRSDGDKEIEILVLRHQLTVLKRQAPKPVFTPSDRFVLAGLLGRLLRDRLRHLALLVRPDTILRWHRDLLRRRHAAACTPRHRGRPPTRSSIRLLVLRLARENPSWGYRRIHGELVVLGVTVAASTVWEILKDHGIDPSHERQHTAWADFLHSQADALLACDFFEVRTLTGARLYVFAVIEHASRRIRILGAATHATPCGRAAGAQENTSPPRPGRMNIRHPQGCRARYLIRDRDAKFPALMDEILSEAGVQTVLAGIRMPRMNAVMERWVQSCRRELLDRCLLWNERHLRHALREYDQFYNKHRAHQARAQAAPLRTAPDPITDPKRIDDLNVHRRCTAGFSTSTHMPLDLDG
ncbi:integrase core domain-containing protein [Nonomuraea sp. NPDC049152]|uniref:integrase core domain-containing protein n=1 Tax=Nonomuraea sp. NPDC049152 TaxID=3154350 RepID=UPI0033E95DBE